MLTAAAEVAGEVPPMPEGPAEVEADVAADVAAAVASKVPDEVSPKVPTKVAAEAPETEGAETGAAEETAGTAGARFTGVPFRTESRAFPSNFDFIGPKNN